MKIGIIGVGQIGSTLIKQYCKAGHNVKMTNASGIEKLKALEIETGAKAVSLNDIAKDVEVLVISIPFVEIPKLAKSLSTSMGPNTIVIDTTNYYPIRDGQIEDIENGMLESVWVSNHLSHPVVKAYNSILFGSLVIGGLSGHSPHRIALPISGDDKNSKQMVASLVNDSGFDALDIGILEDSWRQQPGSPIYCTDLNLHELQNNLNNISISSFPQKRERALQFILKQTPEYWKEWREDCVHNNRIVYETVLKN